MKKDNLVKYQCSFNKRDISYVYVVFFQVTPKPFPDKTFLKRLV